MPEYVSQICIVLQFYFIFFHFLIWKWCIVLGPLEGSVRQSVLVLLLHFFTQSIISALLFFVFFPFPSLKSRIRVAGLNCTLDGLDQFVLFKAITFFLFYFFFYFFGLKSIKFKKFNLVGFDKQRSSYIWSPRCAKLLSTHREDGPRNAKTSPSCAGSVLCGDPSLHSAEIVIFLFEGFE